MFLAPHIPKTGGCTFLQVLKKVFGIRLLHCNRWKKITLSAPNRWLSRWAGRKGVVPAWTSCIFGHYLLPDFSRHFPEADCITWLRHPAERVASEYSYLKRHCAGLAKPDATHAFAYGMLIEQQASLADWAGLPRCRNLQRTFLGPKPIQEFAFVGITEDYDASVELFLRMFSHKKSLAVAAQNTNPDRKGSFYAMDPEVRQLIMSQNEADVQLYERGVERYLQLCRQFSVCSTLAAARPGQAAA